MLALRRARRMEAPMPKLNRARFLIGSSILTALAIAHGCNSSDATGSGGDFGSSDGGNGASSGTHSTGSAHGGSGTNTGGSSFVTGSGGGDHGCKGLECQQVTCPN